MMQFLTTDDLKAGIIDKLLYERNEEGIDDILATIEQHNISLIRSKLDNLYDVDAIFAETGNTRHYLIIKILMKLTIYDFVRRNASRKVPEDYVREWEWAMKTLEQIATGNMVPDGLPPYTDESGNTPNTLWGNTTNKDFYI